MSLENEIISSKIEKLAKIESVGIDPFGESYDKKDNLEDIKNENQIVKTAGRIMSYRRQGKITFCNLEDLTGKVQYCVSRDELGEENYNLHKLLGIGDIIGIEGVTFISSSGELTIRVKSFTLLCKNIRPLPEKYHGLQNIDLRYRQRYIDLIMNKEVKNTFKKRSKIISYIRNYLESKNFLEVETPTMHPIPGGALAKPFVTYHESLDMQLYLKIAPELYLKRLLVGGYEKIFEIGKNFRNEGISTRHNPEFTTIEVYWAYTDYKAMIDLTEDLLSKLALEIAGEEIFYEGIKINFSKPFKKIKYLDSIKEFTGYDLEDKTNEELLNILNSLGIKSEKNWTKQHIITLIFEEKVEKNLIQPTFIYEYPKDISPLAKTNKDNKDIADRFELFIYGRELANGYSELNNPMEQKRNFEKQLENRDLGDEESHMMDDDFIKALEYGMPPASGLGIGIDRLVMLLTNSSSIRDVIFFPQLKKLEK